MTAGYSSPPDPGGFNAQVWDLVRQIPVGRVSTYGRIAAMLQPPAGVDERTYLAFGARWVGGALSQCPSDVPWQRVVNAQGKISLRPGSGYARQRELLEVEGVVFDSRQRIDLKHFGWP